MMENLWQRRSWRLLCPLGSFYDAINLYK